MNTLFSSLLIQSMKVSYLDPGTGSLVLQLLIAAIVGAGAFIKIKWKKIAGFISKDKND